VRVKKKDYRGLATGLRRRRGALISSAKEIWVTWPCAFNIGLGIKPGGAGAVGGGGGGAAEFC